MGISSTSASLLISAITTLLMLPCIVVAMRLMYVSGRRSLLLSTIPVLIATLVVLVTGSILIATLVVLVIGSICYGLKH